MLLVINMKICGCNGAGGSGSVILQLTQLFSSLCRIHYKEYLVGLVNRHGIDPAEVMTAEELTVLLERAEKKVPRRGRDENVAQRTRQLLDVCLTL